MSRVRYVRQHSQEDFSFLNECLISIRHRRKLIYLLTIASLIVATVVVFVYPQSYTATAMVMPSTNNTPTMNMNALVPAAAMLSPGNSQLNLYLELLKSNQVKDSVLAHYGIRRNHSGSMAALPVPEWYDEEDIRQAVGSITASAKIKSGVVNISVTASAPELSADITNNLVYQLDYRLQKLEQDNAARVSGYFTTQVVEARENLRRVEEEKAEFLAKNRNYALSDDPELRVAMEHLEMDVEFHRELLLTLLEMKAKNDLEAEKNIPRLTVIEWAEVPDGGSIISRIKTVMMAVIGMAVFALGLLILRVTYEWYIPSGTRSELANSCTIVGRDAQNVINRIRRPTKIPEQTGA